MTVNRHVYEKLFKKIAKKLITSRSTRDVSATLYVLT